MNSAVKAILFTMILALLCNACVSVGKPAPKIEYYTLEYTPSLMAGGHEQLPLCVKIRRFQVSPLYNSDKIIYRDKAFARNEYHYRKWRANPGDTITYLLKRDLQQSALFKAVFSHEDRITCDYLLEGSVDEFYEKDNADSWEAVLAITIALIKENETEISQRVVFQKSYNARSPCLQKNPQRLSEAMSRALAQVSEQVIRDVVQVFKPIMRRL